MFQTTGRKYPTIYAKNNDAMKAAAHAGHTLQKALVLQVANETHSDTKTKTSYKHELVMKFKTPLSNIKIVFLRGKLNLNFKTELLH